MSTPGGNFLSDGGSLWQVVESDSGFSLEERVGRQTRELVTDAAGVPGDLLRSVWKHAYGLHPDGRQACRGSIEVVESVLRSSSSCQMTPLEPSENPSRASYDLGREDQKWGVAAKVRGHNKSHKASNDPYAAFVGAVSSLLARPQSPSGQGQLRKRQD